MAKKNFDAALKDMEGVDVIDNGKAVTLKGLIIQALHAEIAEERIGAQEKMTRFVLSKKVHKGNEQDYTVEELKTIKDVVGKCYGPMVVGAVYEAIES